MAIRHTFKAYERLKREQHIDTLFRKGKAYSVFPLRLIYLLVPATPGELSPVRVGFSIPKKKFRKAVQRNRIRRLIREAWRQHKEALYNSIPQGFQLQLFLVFTDVKLPDHLVVRDAVEKSMTYLIRQTGKQHE